MVNIAKQKFLDALILTSAIDDLLGDNIGFEVVLCALVEEYLKDLVGVFFAF